jgi:hypothetical protein
MFTSVIDNRHTCCNAVYHTPKIKGKTGENMPESLKNDQAIRRMQ